MRLLLFISIWVLGLAQSLNAQNFEPVIEQDVFEEMAIYVESHLEESFPGEKHAVKDMMQDYKYQGETTPSYAELVEAARRAHWEKTFRDANRNRIMDARIASRKDAGTSRLAGAPLANPDLVVSCSLNIAIVIDQSGSLTGDAAEVANVRAGLNAFVANQVGTGNTVSLIGMGSLGDTGAGAGADGPSTVVYDGGTPNANVHTNWINNTLFQNASSNSDSWSTGLAVAATLPADLVIIIADGATGGAADIAGICAAGNTLKTNGQNGGNGAHLFVFSESPGQFIGSSLPAYLSGGISNPAVEATNPPTTVGISTTDFIGVPNNDDFATLNGWLGSIIPGAASVETTSIWPRTCILHNFTIRGNTSVCDPLTVTSVSLEFSQNGVVLATVPANLNADGTWDFSSTLGSMIDLGLDYGNWYDVVPVMTLSDGSIVSGDDFIGGLNNDVYFADQSDPIVTVNSSPTELEPSQLRFCEGDEIFYHGLDPLSSNHFSAIRKRPIGSSIPFSWYADEGWIGASLDGYNGDLNAQYPGYFEAGWEYELYIATSNTDPDVCIAWTPEKVVFEVVDCCEPNVTFTTPDCVEDGVPFKISVTIEAPITADQIELIYSNYPNFTYVGHNAVEVNGALVLTIGFVSNSCTCEGEQLVFDIVLKGCSETIWIMTEKLPCCASECKKTKIIDWKADDCIIVNGKPARPFCLEVYSQVGIQDIIAGTNDATCQVDLEALEITNVSSSNVYTICGLMVFQDPDCTGHALVSLVLDTGFGCCTIERPFSFPGGCVIDKECTSVDPNIEIIYGSNVQVSLDIPYGETVTVTDHSEGSTSTTTVGTVTCGPFAIDQNGNIFGGSECNGITLQGPKDLDCRASEENPHPSFEYHFEITWGDCVWVIIGDYCRELIVYRSTPTGGGKEKRSSDVESVAKSNAGAIKVFPNPVSATGVLNFDLSELTTGVKEIRVTDVHGKVIEAFVPDTDAKVFQHRLDTPLQHGLYFVIFDLNDGTVSSARLVATE